MPHQVALPDDFCTQENYATLRDYCSRFDPTPETTQVMAKWPSGFMREYRLHCFAKAEDAATFAAHFDGEMFDPKERERGRVNGDWIRTGRPKLIERCGPLELPRFFREYGRK